MALTATPAVKQGLAQVRTRSHRMFCPALAAHAAPGPDKLLRPQMLKGGVIMDVVNAEQAKIAEDAGATGEQKFKFWVSIVEKVLYDQQ